MPRISRYPLKKNDLDEITEHFIYLVSSLRASRDIACFLEEFLTTEEKIMLTKRLVMFVMIKNGYDEQTVRSTLHMSHETIRTYKRKLQEKSQSFHEILEILLHRKRTKQFFKTFEHILEKINTLAKSKTNMKARAKILSGS